MYSRISTGNLKAYHMSILPVKVISEDSFFSLGVDGGGGGGGACLTGVVCDHAPPASGI